MNYRFIAAILAIIGIAVSSAAGETRPLGNGKVLLEIKLDAKKRLFSNLGFTNVSSFGTGQRDSKGNRLSFSVRTGNEQRGDEQKEYVVIITAEGARVKPWRIANEKMDDREELALWQDRTDPTNLMWHVRSGEQLPQGYRPLSVSADWMALQAPDRPPWLAQLDSPTVVVVELPNAHTFTDIFANGQVVHIFARRGWRNQEGPMIYRHYDFAQGTEPIAELTLLWARAVWDMDPDTGLAVINDNNRFWGRMWLLDLKTGKRKWISVTYPVRIVKQEVAAKWKELTKPLKRRD